MMRSLSLVLSGAIALAGGCAGGGRDDTTGTVVEVQALAFAGARVSINGRSTTLDATGHGQLTVLPAMVDGNAVMTVERDGRSQTLIAVCVPGFNPDQGEPVDRAVLFLQRRRTDNACALTSYEIHTASRGTIRGEYTPALFDDGPCGPWLAQ
jgi:hypothetical protein